MVKLGFFATILALFLAFGPQVTLGQCGPYKVVGAACESTSILMGWVGGSGPIQTRIDVTNTTSADLVYRFDYNKADRSPQSLLVQASGDLPGVGTGQVINVAAGQSRSITLLSVANDPAQFVQFWIRAYVIAPTSAILDQQKDSAIKSTIAYAPKVITVALPWSFFDTVVKEIDLRSTVMGNITETVLAPGAEQSLSDKHNMFLLVNVEIPQQVRISILDGSGNVLSYIVTRQVGLDEMLEPATVQTLFGNVLTGQIGNVQARILYEGLGGGKIFVQNIEMLGWCSYAINTIPTWAVNDK
jgi:hypothetical protein